jgi:hypothetical protein
MGINNWLILIKKLNELYIKQANENNHLKSNFLYQTFKNLLEMILLHVHVIMNIEWIVFEDYFKKSMFY